MQKPILFSTSMVRAILDGKKNQTRRIINPQPARCNGCQSCEFKCESFRTSPPWGHHFLISPKQIWSAGDTLWVRETWAQIDALGFVYRADYDDDYTLFNMSGKWKPSIHMPKIACRLHLQVLDVRIERLLQISRFDAYREGISILDKNPVLSFQRLWESINGNDSWGTNPWCWVISFKKI